VSSVVGIATDVTARRRAEEEKERLQAQLLQRRKWRLSASRGRRGPRLQQLLTGILGFSELALLDLDPSSDAGQC